MASPLANLKKSTSPRYLTALGNISCKFRRSSARLLTVPQSEKSEKPFSHEHLSVDFIRPLKCIDLELLHLMHHGVEDENNKYRILGKGGFGTVILFKNQEKAIAVKIIANIKEKSTIEKEKNAIKLNHPNLIKVFDVLMLEDASFGLVLMESWFPLSLQKLIHNSYKPITSQDRLRYLLGIINGLEYCHSMGVVHLDVKPLNILIDPTRKVCKICDFGSSYNLLKINEKITQHWNHQGTIAYAAPELLRGDKPSVKCDTYSFGILMWQFLHCELPYKGISKDVLIYKVVSFGERPSCSNFDESEYSNLYRRCWSGIPYNRPSSSEIKEELHSLLSKVSKKTLPIFQLF